MRMQPPQIFDHLVLLDGKLAPFLHGGAQRTVTSGELEPGKGEAVHPREAYLRRRAASHTL